MQIPTTNLGSGAVLQIVETDFGALAAQSSQIPYDDTIPQISEGFEVMTQAITPKDAASKLLIEADVYGSCAALGELVAALFQNSTANALAADSVTVSSAGFLNNVRLRASIISGATTPQTFRVRIGSAGGTNTAFNGFTTSTTSGAAIRAFGTTPKSSIRITEYKP